MKRLVAKIGSQVLCDPQGQLNTGVLAALVDQVADLRREGWQVLLVSSGAVAAGSGRSLSNRLRKNDPVTRKQVLAATGQVRLMQTYAREFDRHEMTLAQVLASKSDFQTRNHYLNMRNCVEGILGAGITPVINENDVVSVTELMFTDNDELAGLLAAMVGADMLCMLSTVEGVMDGASLIQEWDEAVHDSQELVADGTSRLGRGGMQSKIAVARKTAALGTEVVIADGRSPGVLVRAASGLPGGTRFPAGEGTSPAKRWLASARDHALGSIRINDGAAQALRDATRLASLLPVGAVSLEGEFKRGDVVQIVDEHDRVLGVGRAQYDSGEARRLVGQKGHKPLIHSDYLYMAE